MSGAGPSLSSCRPRLAARARLRWDRRDKRLLLLYPERGLCLNRTAAEILLLCDGNHTLCEIVDALARKKDRQVRARIERDVGAFLHELFTRHLLVDAAQEPA